MRRSSHASSITGANLRSDKYYSQLPARRERIQNGQKSFGLSPIPKGSGQALYAAFFGAAVRAAR
jgi:hypothetical protein